MEEEHRNAIVSTLLVCLQATQSFSDCMNYLALQASMDNTAKGERLIRKSRRKRRNECKVWAYARSKVFVDQQLLGSYSARMFKQRLRVSRETFHFICGHVSPHIRKNDTCFRAAVPLETRVAIALSRLATGNSLAMIADLHGVGVSTCHEIVLQFAMAMIESLHKSCIKWPGASRMRTLADEFKDVKEIPNVVGAIDGSHIPIISPSKHPQDYYNRKGFHSILLQLVVSSECLIWDYDVGWAGSMHDWTLFLRSHIGKMCHEGALGEFCLVGDAAYPPRYWMLSPYKGHKEGLSPKEYHWNYVQSSTRMAVERSFGILKARWRILLKRIDMKLEYVPPVVVACLILHNLCITHEDSFDEIWIDEIEEELRFSQNHCNESHVVDMEASNACVDALNEIRGFHGVDFNSMECSNEVSFVAQNETSHLYSSVVEDVEEVEATSSKAGGKLLRSGVKRRDSLATLLYDKYTQNRMQRQH